MSGCDCAHARTHLEELIRGELTAVDCGPIREHLATCTDCSDEQHVFEQLTVAVRRACAEPAPPSLRDAILNGMQELHTRGGATAEPIPAPNACGCGANCRCS